MITQHSDPNRRGYHRIENPIVTCAEHRQLDFTSDPYGLGVDRAILCALAQTLVTYTKGRCHYCYFAGHSKSTSSMAPACPICYVEYDSYQAGLRPRVLPCGHTLCTECLGKCSLGEVTSILPSCQHTSCTRSSSVVSAQADSCSCLQLLATAQRVEDLYCQSFLTRTCTLSTMHLKTQFGSTSR